MVIDLKRWLVRVSCVVISSWGVLGCSAAGDSSGDFLGMNATLIDTSAGTRSVIDLSRGFGVRNLISSVEDPATSELKGVYFGELEIVAYDYRPGESVQANSNWGYGTDGSGAEDWSYWVVVQSGHPAARDYVLPMGGTLEFNQLNDDYQPDPIEEDFVNAVGSFSVDFFEVALYRTGIVIGDSYFGMNAEYNGLSTHPLHRYTSSPTDWDGYPDYFVTPTFAEPSGSAVLNTSEQIYNVLFASSEYFSSPVRVRMDRQDDGYVVSSSSVNLTDTQKQVLESMANQGTGRRFYANFIIVPFEGPKTYDLTTGQAPTVTVNMNLTDIVSPSSVLSDVADDRELIFNTDSNGIPFGLSVQFGD